MARPRKNHGDVQLITFYLRRPMMAILDQIARERTASAIGGVVSRADVIREAVTQYVAAHDVTNTDQGQECAA